MTVGVRVSEAMNDNEEGQDVITEGFLLLYHLVMGSNLYHASVFLGPVVS